MYCGCKSRTLSSGSSEAGDIPTAELFLPCDKDRLGHRVQCRSLGTRHQVLLSRTAAVQRVPRPGCLASVTTSPLSLCLRPSLNTQCSQLRVTKHEPRLSSASCLLRKYKLRIKSTLESHDSLKHKILFQNARSKRMCRIWTITTHLWNKPTQQKRGFTVATYTSWY